MTWLLAGVAAILLIWALVAAALSAQPPVLLRVFRFAVAALATLAAVALVAMGRFRLALVPAGIVLLVLAPWGRMTSGRAPAPPGGESEANSRYLRMTLDHESGDMLGEVIGGPMQGAMLGDLALEDLLRLLAICRAEDPEGTRLLEAWLERSPHAARWREADAERGHGQAARGPMTRDEAAEILGVAATAPEDEIRAAYRRLMAANHPDRGGSPWLAQQINRARDVLLGG